VWGSPPSESNQNASSPATTPRKDAIPSHCFSQVLLFTLFELKRNKSLEPEPMCCLLFPQQKGRRIAFQLQWQ
jgi:hypothetical protein